MKIITNFIIKYNKILLLDINKYIYDCKINY